MDQQSGSSVFTIGRMVSWLMVTLMFASAVYALSMAVVNWSVIRV